LKLGLYTSPGPVTCGGYVGSHGYEEQDARAFAAWGIDYLKYDWCSAWRVYPPADARAVYQKMGDILRRCGRPIAYSLSPGLPGIWEWARDAGANLWRTTDDIKDTWQSMSAIGFNQSDLAHLAGPGHWNDPDMLEVGNGGMTDTEYRTHFSLWCLLAAPLLAGNDLRTMSPETLAILSNREAIAIDQDILGRAGQRVAADDGVELWLKPLHDGGQAVGVFNRNETEKHAHFPWSAIGRDAPPESMRDLWLHADVAPNREGISANIPAHGVLLLRLR
jgi:alpha-galactosidase